MLSHFTLHLKLPKHDCRQLYLRERRREQTAETIAILEREVENRSQRAKKRRRREQIAMDSSSSEASPLIEFMGLTTKRRRTLTPEREPQPVEEDNSRERESLLLRPDCPLRLGLGSPNSARMTEMSPADDMVRVRMENSMLKKEISLLHAANRELCSRLQQPQDLLHNSSSPSSNDSTSRNGHMGRNNLQQRDGPETATRRVKVLLNTRAGVQKINDGCQWRKYGQKTAKKNPLPKSYYRCTMSDGCPVRKHIQTWANDHSILSTTYVGQHNHPLPPSAMFVSSITMSATEMLLSGSMYNMAMIPREIVPFFAPGLVDISNSDSIILDMTNAPHFSSPLQRNLQIVDAQQPAVATQVIETVTASITSNPSFQAALAAKVSSIISARKP